jgi:hypothetical protein
MRPSEPEMLVISQPGMAYKWDGLQSLSPFYRRPGFLFYVFCRNVSSSASPGSDFLFLLASEIKECSTWNVSAKLKPFTFSASVW